MSTHTVVAVSDVHIDHGRWGVTNPRTGRNTAWESTYRCWMAACSYAAEIHADGFLMGGDSTMNGRPSAEASEMLADGYRLLARAGVPVIDVLGNHDPIGVRAGHRHPLLRFTDIDAVEVVDQPRLVTLPCGLQVACLPWPLKAEVLATLGVSSDLTPSEIDTLIAGEMADAVDRLAEACVPERPALLLAHAAVGEATIGSALRGSEMALLSLFSEPVVPLEALEREPFQHVVLGHIHKGQQIGSRAHYIGSPDCFTFGEQDETKTFSVLQLDAEHGVTLQRVPTPARRLVTVALDDPEASGVLDSIRDDTLVRLMLPAGESRVDPRMQQLVAAAGGRIVKVETRPALAAPSARLSASEGISPLDGLRLLCEARDITGEARERLLRLGAELIESTLGDSRVEGFDAGGTTRAAPQAA